MYDILICTHQWNERYVSATKDTNSTMTSYWSVVDNEHKFLFNTSSNTLCCYRLCIAYRLVANGNYLYSLAYKPFTLYPRGPVVATKPPRFVRYMHLGTQGMPRMPSFD